MFTRDFFDPLDVNNLPDVYEVRSPAIADLASRGNGDERTGGSGSAFVALSDDGDQVLFRTEAHLVPEDSGRVAGRDVYVREAGITSSLNQRSGGGVVSRCGSQAPPVTNRHVISNDNRKIFFEVPDISASGDPEPSCADPRQVYMRDGESTVHVSASQRSPADPGGMQAAAFEGATADGTKVYFTSAEMLTDQAEPGGGLYVYDSSAGTPTLRLLLTAYPQLNGIVKIADNGSRIYFTSYFDLTGSGQGVPGDEYLYVIDDAGQIEQIAYSPGGTGLFALGGGAEDSRLVELTPDGRFLLFLTGVRLSTFDHSGYLALYLYDAEKRTTTCISCDPAGQRPPGSAVRSSAAFGTRSLITPDARLIAFTSGDQLVPGDTNTARDVYEYSAGRLTLLSPGRTTADADIIGVSTSGRDIFFTTTDSLVPSDEDGGDSDVYDARLGGGFAGAATVTPGVHCLLDGCQGPATSPPVPEVAGSELLKTPEARVTSANRFTVAAISKRAQQQFAKTGKLTLRVTTTGGGVLTVRALGITGTKSRSVALATKRLTRTRTVASEMLLSLSRWARRRLATSKGLKVRIVTRLSGVSRASTVSLTLTRASS